MKLRLPTVSVLAAALLAPVVGSQASANHPETIDLPDGFAGEGVATGRLGTFYAGSRADGRVARGDLAGDERGVRRQTVGPRGDRAEGRPAARPAVGVRRGNGPAAVYDLDTGKGVEDAVDRAVVINDVVVTRDAAYFTNSLWPVIYRVPCRGGARSVNRRRSRSAARRQSSSRVQHQRDRRHARRAHADRRQQRQGALYTVDARTGASAEIDLGGDTVPTGDGILLVGRYCSCCRTAAPTASTRSPSCS